MRQNAALWKSWQLTVFFFFSPRKTICITMVFSEGTLRLSWCPNGQTVLHGWENSLREVDHQKAQRRAQKRDGARVTLPSNMRVPERPRSESVNFVPPRITQQARRCQLHLWRSTIALRCTRASHAHAPSGTRHGSNRARAPWRTRVAEKTSSRVDGWPLNESFE